MKPVIIIPCFNDNKFINILIENILSNYNIDIVVIDDGSFVPVEIALSRDTITLLRNSSNKGKGYSLKKALNYVFERNYTHAITMDADLQHDPIYIKDFINIDKNIDIVIGRRDFSQNMPVHRRFSNKVTSYITSAIIGKKILDSQSGYRRYKLESKEINNCIEDGFQFETEILISELAKKGSIVEHILITTLYNNEKSSINNVLDTYKFIKMILRKIINK